MGRARRAGPGPRRPQRAPFGRRRNAGAARQRRARQCRRDVGRHLQQARLQIEACHRGVEEAEAELLAAKRRHRSRDHELRTCRRRGTRDARRCRDRLVPRRSFWRSTKAPPYRTRPHDGSHWPNSPKQERNSTRRCRFPTCRRAPSSKNARPRCEPARSNCSGTRREPIRPQSCAPCGSRPKVAPNCSTRSLRCWRPRTSW